MGRQPSGPGYWKILWTGGLWDVLAETMMQADESQWRLAAGDLTRITPGAMSSRGPGAQGQAQAGFVKFLGLALLDSRLSAARGKGMGRVDLESAGQSGVKSGEIFCLCKAAGLQWDPVFSGEARRCERELLAAALWEGASGDAQALMDHYGAQALDPQAVARWASLSEQRHSAGSGDEMRGCAFEGKGRILAEGLSAWLDEQAAAGIRSPCAGRAADKLGRGQVDGAWLAALMDAKPGRLAKPDWVAAAQEREALGKEAGGGRQEALDRRMGL